VTIQLPKAKSPLVSAGVLPGLYLGLPITIVDIGGLASNTNTITILPVAGETISGGTSIVINTKYGAVILQPNLALGVWSEIPFPGSGNLPFFDIRTFGGVCDSNNSPGNGTDNTAALRAAVAAMPITGGILYIPAMTGSCRITNNITINKPIIIQGPGWAATGPIYGLYADFSVGVAAEVLLFTTSGGQVRDLAFVANQPTPATGTVTIDIANPAIIHWPGSNRNSGNAIVFETTGALPTGIVADTAYYVLPTGLTADQFQIAIAPGFAAVVTSGTQSGTHTAAAFGADANPWGIHCYRAPFANDGGNDIKITNVMMANISHGIYMDGSERTVIDGMYGNPLIQGIKASQQFDVIRVHNVHFFPFWGTGLNFTGLQSRAWNAWTGAWATAFWFGRVDNPIVSNFFTFGYRIGLSFNQEAGPSSPGTTSLLQGLNLGFDDAIFGIMVNTGASGTTMQLSNLYFTGAADVSTGIDTFGLFLQDPSFSQVQMENAEFHNSDYAIYNGGGGAAGTGNSITGTNCSFSFGGYARGKNYPAITSISPSIASIFGGWQTLVGHPFASGLVTLTGPSLGADPSIWAVNTNNVEGLYQNNVGQVGFRAGALGVTDGSAAAAGIIGEYVPSSIAAPGTTLTSAAAKDVTSIILPAGDWDVRFSVSFRAATTTTVTFLQSSISATLNTMDYTPGSATQQSWMGQTIGSIGDVTQNVGPVRISSNGSTTVHGVVLAGFATAGCTAYGLLSARRVR
jgi:hypothetical protein